MPTGVGAHIRAVRVIRVVVSASLAVVGLAVFASPARAQAAPTLTIQKVAVGADVSATFEVTGPNINGTATLTANALDSGPPAVASPPLTGLQPGGNYLITETQPEEGLTPFDTTFACTNDAGSVIQSGNSHQVIVTLSENITCTFTNTLAGATILANKIVTGDTSTWVRPAQFHITCPELQVDIDIEPPVGPGGPGTYVIGQGAIPPATCTISETDTGSNGFVSVSMVMRNHGIVIALGASSLTFTSHVGDDLVLTVTNTFAAPVLPERPEPGTTTTIAGSTTTTTPTTTTTVATSTTATTAPGGGAGTSTPGDSTGGASTTPPQELPTTGSPATGLIVGALVAMIAGVVLVARSKRFV